MNVHLATALMAIALAPAATGCAAPKVSDATRYGRPILDTTIATIRADPETWDNKWVRLIGHVNGSGSVLYGNECLAKALSTQTEDDCLDNQPPNPDGHGHSFAENRKLVDLNGYDIFDLDPETHRPSGEDRDHSSISPAVVVGRVDLACWHWSQPFLKWIEDFMAANPDQIPLIHPYPPEKIAYCYGLSGEPHLDKVLISRGGAQ